jgi:hypothetical protein
VVRRGMKKPGITWVRRLFPVNFAVDRPDLIVNALERFPLTVG